MYIYQIFVLLHLSSTQKTEKKKKRRRPRSQSPPVTAAPVRRAKNARHRPSVQLCDEVVEWCWMVRKCEKCRPKILRIARARSPSPLRQASEVAELTLFVSEQEPAHELPGNLGPRVLSSNGLQTTLLGSWTLLNPHWTSQTAPTPTPKPRCAQRNVADPQHSMSSAVCEVQFV